MKENPDINNNLLRPNPSKRKENHKRGNPKGQNPEMKRKRTEALRSSPPLTTSLPLLETTETFIFKNEKNPTPQIQKRAQISSLNKENQKME